MMHELVEEFHGTYNDGPICMMRDNFITTSLDSRTTPRIYTKVFVGLGHPLDHINSFFKKILT